MKFSPELLNTALNLSMEFGGNWLLSIAERLSKMFTELDSDAVLHLDKLCKQVNKVAHQFISDHPVKDADGISFVKFSLFETFMISKYDWIDDENLSKLYSQGCYYALK